MTISALVAVPKNNHAEFASPDQPHNFFFDQTSGVFKNPGGFFCR